MHSNLTESYPQLWKLVKQVHLTPAIVDRVIEQQLARNEDYTILFGAWENKWSQQSNMVINPPEDANKKGDKDKDKEGEASKKCKEKE